MKIAVTGDIHGSQTWKKININNFDKLILLGDYHDSYGDVSREDEIKNFKQIIEFKKQYSEQVILLLGNHDINQYLLNEPCSRKAPYRFAQEITKLLEDNLNLFQVAVQFGDFVISHAGISKTWMKKIGVTNIDEINQKLQNKEYEIFTFDGDDRYGNDATQGPTWIRPKSLVLDAAYKNQIVGHTQVREAPAILNLNGNKVIILECPTHDTVYEFEV